MDKITEITEAALNALAQIQQMAPETAPMPEMVHQQLSTYIEQGMRTAGRLGYPQQDVEDMRYALVALADEVVLQKGGPLRDFWLPRMLQLRHFHENIAGDAFFERLAEIRRDPARTDVLRVYYLCLMFGFRGKYRVRGGEIDLADVVDGVRDDLIKAGAIENDMSLSPRGPRPYEAIADARRNMLLLWLAGVAAIASVLLYLGLKLSLMNQADQLVERFVALTGG